MVQAGDGVTQGTHAEIVVGVSEASRCELGSLQAVSSLWEMRLQSEQDLVLIQTLP